jgi:predicted nucleotidyltransferase
MSNYTNFGKSSRNEATENSDIDVMLISEVFDRSNDIIRAKAWTVTEKIDVRIEPYMVGLHRFTSDDVSPLLQIVKHEGIEI